MRLFGNTNRDAVWNGSRDENGTGKMDDFTGIALQSIKDMGFTHIWYTGIIEHATCEGFPQFEIFSQHPSVVKGRAGSPYAITDYYDVNPYLAENVEKRMEEFESLVQRTHDIGMKVIIDFVPNHVARQYKSDQKPETDFGLNDDDSKAFSLLNDFYYVPGEPLYLSDEMGTFFAGRGHDTYHEYPAKATGNDQFHANPTLNDWYETVKLNYGVDYFNGRQKYFDPVPPLWEKMVAILDFWCSKYVDGIRCDMAEMVPVEFWNFAISWIKQKYPDVIFIAEVYNPGEYQSYVNIGRFDYLYDKVGLYDTLRSIICTGSPAFEITQTWQSLNGIDDLMLRFLENHDEQRIASRFFASDPFYALPAMVVAATMNCGPVMVYFGQELGEPATGESGYSGDDGRTTIFDFYNVPEHQKWFNNGEFNTKLLSKGQIELRNYYSKLLNFAINSSAVSQGKFYDLMWGNNFNGGPDTRYIYAYLRYSNNEKLLVVVNFNKNESQQFNLKIPADAIHLMQISEITALHLKDNFSNTAISINVIQIINDGIELRLEALQCCIFSIKVVNDNG